MKERDRGQRISVGLDLNVTLRKYLFKEPAQAERSESPVFLLVPNVLGIDLLDTRSCNKNHTAGFQDAVKCPDRGIHVVDAMKNLSAENAVKGVGWYFISMIVIGDDCWVGVVGGKVKHINLRSFGATELPCISIVAEIQDMTPYVVRIQRQKTLNVIAIDALASTLSIIIGIDRQGPAQETRTRGYPHAATQPFQLQSLISQPGSNGGGKNRFEFLDGCHILALTMADGRRALYGLLTHILL